MWWKEEAVEAAEFPVKSVNPTPMLAGASQTGARLPVEGPSQPSPQSVFGNAREIGFFQCVYRGENICPVGSKGLT